MGASGGRGCWWRLSVSAVHEASVARWAVRRPRAKGRAHVSREACVIVMAAGNMRVMLCHEAAQEA